MADINHTYGNDSSANNISLPVFNNYQNINNINYDSNSTKLSDDYTIENLLIICGYFLIVCISLCGNLIVCKIMLCKKIMWTTTNLLIASLAFSDLIITVFNIPFYLAIGFSINWPFGSFMCFLVYFISISCVYVSTYTMAAIALVRWWTINSKTALPRFSCVKITCLMVFIWLLAGLLSLPHSIFREVQSVKVADTTYYRCRLNFPEIHFIPSAIQFLSIEIFITQFMIPIMITLIIYIRIGFIVWSQGKVFTTYSDKRKRQRLKEKTRRILMLTLVVTFFTICWLPYRVYCLLVDFRLVQIRHEVNVVLYLVVYWLTKVSVCCNPFLYYWLNDSFRKEAQHIILSVWKCRKQT